MPHKKSMKSGKYSRHHGKGVAAKLGIAGPVFQSMHKSVGKRGGPKMGRKHG